MIVTGDSGCDRSPVPACNDVSDPSGPPENRAAGKLAVPAERSPA